MIKRIKFRYSEILMFSCGLLYFLLTFAILIILFLLDYNQFKQVYDVLIDIRNLYVAPFLAGSVVGYYGTKLLFDRVVVDNGTKT